MRGSDIAGAKRSKTPLYIDIKIMGLRDDVEAVWGHYTCIPDIQPEGPRQHEASFSRAPQPCSIALSILLFAAFILKYRIGINKYRALS